MNTWSSKTNEIAPIPLSKELIFPLAERSGPNISADNMNTNKQQNYNYNSQPKVARSLVISVVGSLFLSSCAVIVRESFAQPHCDSCNTIRAMPIEQNLSRFVLIGPILPLFPLWIPYNHPTKYVVDLDHDGVKCPLLITSHNDTIHAVRLQKPSINRCIYDKYPKFDEIKLVLYGNSADVHYIKRVEWSSYFGLSE